MALCETVLAIDPALRKTGWAILKNENKIISATAFGVITNSPKLLPSSCLLNLHEQLFDLFTKYQPTVCAIESTIYVQSHKIAISLGTSRAAALIAAARHGISIFEYSPKEVKLAAVGKGAASKDQVAFMMRSILRLTVTPPADAADALAIGMAHWQNSHANLIGAKINRQI
jgi:crossover junction endodeoxyribonuclease RuvC